ncbi:MAG: hypothetical protein RBQ74_05160, partial [Defluviitoga tunisiensis]|nr:hypothetical protein [Defluviitoga tunisiensis]
RKTRENKHIKNTLTLSFSTIYNKKNKIEKAVICKALLKCESTIIKAAIKNNSMKKGGVTLLLLSILINSSFKK